jgi:hypothetical protein
VLDDIVARHGQAPAGRMQAEPPGAVGAAHPGRFG